MGKNKIVGFRPTDLEQQKLKEYMAAHGIKKSSAAIRAMAFLMPKSVTSSMVDKPVKAQEIEQRYSQKLVLIPPNLPNVKREIAKFLRGQKSDLVKALLEITPDSLNRAFTVATPKGIMAVIPSTTTHDTEGGFKEWMKSNLEKT